MSEIKIYEIMNELKEYRIPDDYDEDKDDEEIENPTEIDEKDEAL